MCEKKSNMDIQDRHDNPEIPFTTFSPHPVNPVYRCLMYYALGVLLSGIVFSASAQIPTASPSRIDPSAYQRLVDENLELRREKLKMEAEVGDLRRRNAALLVDLQDLERRNNQFAALMSQLKTPEEMKADVARLQSEKQVLIREIDRLHRALAEVTPPPSNSVPVVSPAPGSDLFRKIEKENADLRQDLAKVRETLQNETGAKTALSRSDVSMKNEIARLSGERKTVDAELAATVRREASLKKALDVQARKAFEAEKAAREAKEQLLEARNKQANAEAVAKKAAAELASGRVAGGGQSGKSGVDKGKTVDMTGPSVVKLLTSGRQFLMEKKVQEAEDVYLQALKLDPQNPQVTYNLGVLYGDYLDNPRKAASYYRQYLKYAPRASDAAAVRGWIMELEARSR